MSGFINQIYSLASIDFVPLIYHVVGSDIVPSIFRFAKASYCTVLSVLPIYLVSSRKPQRIVLGLQDLASASACLLVCIPVLLRNLDILVFA